MTSKRAAPKYKITFDYPSEAKEFHGWMRRNSYGLFRKRQGRVITFYTYYPLEPFGSFERPGTSGSRLVRHTHAYDAEIQRVQKRAVKRRPPRKRRT